MNHNPRFLLTCLFTVFLVVVSGHASAREGILIPKDSSRAWQSPLATQSLLLAIGKFGDRIVTVGERGHILYKGEGHEWLQAKVPTRMLLTGLSFFGEQRGWAVGHDALILSTSDGARTWHKVHEAVDEQRPLLDVRFWSNRMGIAVGAYGYLLKTQDGGANWHADSVNEEHDFHLNAIAVTPRGLIHETQSAGGTGRIYIAAEAGYVYRSDDEGNSWRTLNRPYDGSFFGIHPIDENKVMVFGMRGHLFVSEDAGEHWRSVDTGTHATLTSVVDLGNGRFLFIGHAGVLLLLNSDPEQVHRAQLSERKALSDVIEVGPNRVLLVGEEGIRNVDLCKIFPKDALPGCFLSEKS
uniref:Photosynthesis system II assembly factor Ycf48/Hcf136-like domain-containing protein n=1 Tax=Candidatus Kentrum sp. FW TaxID=2126338 RepID=A0A450SXZ1_9GAMM|nr:MAG: Uncharacterized protein BECKFW1821A_GA0114235_10875 [Candidatus Kentron sp. FW]